MYKFVFLTMCLFVVLLFGSEQETPEIIPITLDQLKERGIAVQPVQGGVLKIGVTRRGKVILHPDHVAYVLAQVPGVVLEARKNVGDRVAPGEVLALLQSKDLADLQAEYLINLNKGKVAEALFTRENTLHEKGLDSEEDFLNARSSLQETQLNNLILQQKLKALGMTTADIEALPENKIALLGIYALRAPIAGQILERNLSKGQYLDSNATVYKVADLKTLWVEIGVYPKDAALVKQGQQISITSTKGSHPIEAHMVALHPLIEEDTILSKVIAEVDNEAETLLPGSFVNTELIIDTPHVAISIPKEAVQTIEEEEVVFVSHPQGFEKRPIKTGRCDNKCVEVLSGLTEGEVIPIHGTFLFKAESGKSSVEPDDDDD